MKKITFILFFILLSLSSFSAWEAPDDSIVKDSYLTIYTGVLDIIDAQLLDDFELKDSLITLRDQMVENYDPALLGDYVDRIETKGILLVESLTAYYREYSQVRLINYDFFDQLKTFLLANPLYIRTPSDEIADYFYSIDTPLIRIPDRIIKTRGFFYYRGKYKYHFNDSTYYYIPSKYITQVPVSFSDALDNYIDATIEWNDEWFVETMGYLNEKFGFPNPYKLIENASETGIVTCLPSEKISYTQKEIKGFRIIHGEEDINENEVLSAEEYALYQMATSTCHVIGLDFPFKPDERLNDAVYQVDKGLLMHVKGYPDRTNLIIQSSTFYPRPYDLSSQLPEIRTKPRDLVLEKMDGDYERLLTKTRDLIENARKQEKGDFKTLKTFVEELDRNFQPYWQYYHDETKIRKGMIENLSIGLQKRIDALISNLEENNLADPALIEDIRVILKENPQSVRVIPDELLNDFIDNGISFDRVDAVFMDETDLDSYVDARFINSRPVDFFKLAEAVEKITGTEIDEGFISEAKPETLQSTDTTLIAYTVIESMVSEILTGDKTLPVGVLYPHIYCTQSSYPEKDYLSEEQIEQFKPADPDFISYTEDSIVFRELFRHYMWMFLNNHLNDVGERDEFPCTIIMDAELFEAQIR
ncbi:MAG TPA: hypothetical protein PLO84_05805 [Thermotogota bacterium]|nr:hypothetical protein [Thermotogota bacterium]HPJ88620.1 hypothetical protein [Thermotogota bacterium]